jgi:hypothetical protein
MSSRIRLYGLKNRSCFGVLKAAPWQMTVAMFLRCALLSAMLLAIGVGSQVLTTPSAGFRFSGADTGSIKLSRPTDPVALGRGKGLDRWKLQNFVTVRNAAGEVTPSVVFSDSDDRLWLRAPAIGTGYQLEVRPGLTDSSGRPYEGPQSIRVQWDHAPAQIGVTQRDRSFYGVNTNASPNVPIVVAGWAKQLGVGFVRLGWGSIGSNPQCKSLAELDQWSWKAIDMRIDAYQKVGVGVLLVPLQFTTPACANGGSSDTRAIMDTPERYGEYVEGLVSHVTQRNPGAVIAVELGNEPDVDHFWITASGKPHPSKDASAYFAYLKAGSQAVRRVEKRSGHKIIVMNAGFGAANMDWWRSLMHQPGMNELVDALNVHIYPWAGPPPAHQPPAHNSFDDYTAEIEAARAAGLGHKPFWITELGVQSSPTCPWSVDEQTHAKLLNDSVEFFARQQKPTVAAVALFSIQDDTRDRTKANPRNPLGNCYLLQGLGLIDDRGRPRPAFSAYAERIAESSARSSR